MSRRKNTREHILDTALKLFRRRGFDKTTMREIADEARMSLGAAYYYFSSKEALVLGYYERVSAAHADETRAAFETATSLRERIAAVYHTHFELVRRDRKLLGAMVRTVGDVDSPIGLFASGAQPMRDGAVSLLREAIAVPEVPDDLRDQAALALWVLQLAIVLYMVWDDSPEQKRTRKLIDDCIEVLLPVVPLLASPFAAPIRRRIMQLLCDADLVS